ncbi:hypothetical protein NHX12_007708 [Muraenolepis orangiensis]|uniref:Dopey N-terminal domain-containing protein n=1 Tax=Muraenolepis orangiensis TaxID=630683 RepID=A0A9Q0DQF0_9TELE|nr:hypothetical protein NHX12_007708 [Muraenolepis orangiensis]
MDPEEAELQNDYRYRSYSVAIEKALRSFESSSEWADLISSLGKLNKALQSNLRYSLLPKRLIIGKRLAQCLHPALPSGVHLKALETYEVIFKIIGTKWLAKDLFIYSSGLFPLLGHGSMAVKPVLLMLYERYYLPLQRALLPSLQAFITGLLPGMEEGLEVFDRTDALLLRLSLLVGQQVFYGALWGSVLVSPLVRLPATLFIVTHFDRAASPRQQSYMLGYDHRLVKSVCLALQDANVLVQRNMLEILLHFFPFNQCLEDVVTVASAAVLTLLRRDMSLNRRLYSWLLGMDTKRQTLTLASSPRISNEDQTVLYFNLYSRDFLVQALINILKQKDIQSDPENLMNYLRPFRVIVALLDKPEIGPVVIDSLLLEVVRAFYRYCRQMLGEDTISRSGLAGNQLASKVKENKNGLEVIKSMNLLMSSVSGVVLWEHMSRLFCTSLSEKSDTPSPPEQVLRHATPTITEMSTLSMFLLEVLPLELHADIQSQLLPEVLGTMLCALHDNMATVSPAELTVALQACFKILSKIQMPVAYMDLEAESTLQEGDSQGPEETGEPAEDGEKEREPDSDRADITSEREAVPGEGVLSQLCSEDSGLGVSASPSEQHLDPPAAGPGGARSTGKEGEDVWRKDGSVDAMTQHLTHILAFITTRYLLVEVEDSPGGQRRAAGRDGWAEGFMPRGRSEIPEPCRQAFTAACHLLLECSTFPVYLSEEESQDLYSAMFTQPDLEEALPAWLVSLMILCCSTRDYGVQHTAVATFLELVNHSQSLALVIQDKHRRYGSCVANPLSGRLQMVTVPPVLPGTLAAIEEGTNFYQRVAQVLWAQLDTERREQHISCVELFYRLHSLAPSPSVCEDIICQALLHKDKAARLEALHRFSVLWHLTREIQNNRTMSLNRSFDRSLCVVLGSLGASSGSVSAAAQCWLVRALSLDDVVRVLEPILLLLLHPGTQHCSIQSIKQNLTAGNLKALSSRSRSSTKGSEATIREEATASDHMDLVDREALWKELETDPEAARAPDAAPASWCSSEPTEEDSVVEDDPEPEESEHTESADTSGAQVSVENSSSSSGPFRSSLEEGAVYNGLCRVESEHTQVSDSLSSEDEDDQELEAMAKSRLLKQEREKREAIDSLFHHVLLYPEAGGCGPLLQGLGLLASLLRSSAQRPLVDALSQTALDTGSAAHLNLVANLLQRHQQSQDGGSFYGRLLSPASSPSAPPPLLLELLMSLCLRFLRSHYPLQAGNSAQQEAIRRLLSECQVQQYTLLALSASMYVSQRGPDKAALRGTELLEEKGGLSEESLVHLGAGGGQEQYPLQVELLKLTQALIILEDSVAHGASSAAASLPGGARAPPEEPCESPTAGTPLAREWQTAVLFQQSIKAAQYVQNQPITAQGMFVSAATRALQPQYGYAMHPHWVSLLCSSLPYLGRSLGIVLAPIIGQICVNLDELVKVYEHDGGKVNQSLSARKENIAPDYPLTLLEGLTTITHHCLLDHKKSLTACDPADLRNARNAVVEELPHMLSSMTLLWAVLKREEGLRRGGPEAEQQGGRRSATSSLYFRSTKILRQRILDFLTPLTGQYGVQIMASVGSVWSSKRSKRRHRNKVLPLLTESRLIVVDLVKSLSSMRPDTVLHLVKEVVKKPHQIKTEQKNTLVDVPMLEFSYAYILSLSPQTLQENIAPLLSLLRESAQLNLAPPGHFLLLGILNDFVNRLPNLDNKKDSRDLQEVTQRILEAVGGVAGSSLEQTSWLSRNLEVKNQPQRSRSQTSTMISSSAPSVYSVQALALLAEILAPLLDMVYRSDEKEKAVPLITRTMYYVFPYLKNHSAYNMPSFGAGAQLLSSLSGYAYTKRTWRKEAFELFMDPLFFTMDSSCAPHWRSIIDHLLTHEKTMFKDLMSMQSSSLKLFPSSEQKPMLLKRQAFAMFSGEVDQYHLYLPLIQERLSESLRGSQTPSVTAQNFLLFRVLLLRISPQHLTSLWPIMVTELVRIFARLNKTLQSNVEVSKLSKVVRGALVRHCPVNIPQSELDMYLSACKFLDTSLAFPPDKMPLFQMYRWAFVPEVDVDRYSGPDNVLLEGEQECKPHVLRILEAIQLQQGVSNGLAEESSTEPLEFPLLTQRSLPSIGHLVPFFRTLCCSFQGPAAAHDPAQSQPIADYPAASGDGVLRRLEAITEEEFLDVMEG